MNVSLEMFKSDGSRHEFPLTKSRTVIGRTNSCDLRIPVGSVSREHCEILIEDGEVVVRDLGSSNGTYHNDIRVQEANLSSGDQLTVGPVQFKVHINGETEGDSDKAGAAAGRAGQPKPAAGDEAEQKAERPQTPSAPDEQSQQATEDLDDPIAALEALSEMDDDLSGPNSEEKGQ